MTPIDVEIEKLVDSHSIYPSGVDAKELRNRLRVAMRELIPLIREECAKIAERDKWEQRGVIVAAVDRCDGGASERCADRIAAAIREGK